MNIIDLQEERDDVIQKILMVYNSQLETEQNELALLKLKIEKQELEINGYRIELNNATDPNEKSGLRGDISNATTCLHDLSQQFTRLQPTSLPVTTVFKYFKVSAQITNSKSYAWRAKIFALADECNGFYCSGGEPESIYYNDDTLVLAILFESTQDARRFRRELQRRAEIFHIVSLVTVGESYDEVILEAEAKEIRALHYHHGESGSPEYSDYKSQDAEESVISVVDADDAYRTLQMIEDPNHPIFYGRDFYTCYLASQANHKKDKNNPNNLLILSWLTHQSFDGLNLVTNQHMVPSIAIQFVEFNGTETLEFNNGYPFEKDKVTIRIESPDPKVLEGIGMLLKPGSTLEEGKMQTFVHVDSWEEFKKFLTIKYNETKSLWDRQTRL